MLIDTHLIALIILTLIVLMITFPVMGQTRMSDQGTETYFGNCMDLRDERMSEETQAIFCECTSLQMQQNISVEEIQAMRGNDQRARNVINKVMLNVYAPCMEFPVRDLIYNKCRENKFQASQNICSCLSEEMGKFTATSAKASLGNVLASNPNITDPMGPILESPEFVNHEKRTALSCIQQQ